MENNVLNSFSKLSIRNNSTRANEKTNNRSSRTVGRLSLARHRTELLTKNNKIFNTSGFRSKNNGTRLLTKRCTLNMDLIVGRRLTVISSGETVSGANVSKFIKKGGRCYIIKKVVINDKPEDIHNLRNECLIYANIINKLISNKITPYCIRCSEYVICNTTKTKTEINIINETVDESNAKFNKLKDFITNNIFDIKQFCNIMFQITYTLQCFNNYLQ
jgi:hypothetical protein